LLPKVHPIRLGPGNGARSRQPALN
jgi:hypothetical protein